MPDHAGRNFCHPQQARYPNHVWMLDITEIPGFFSIFNFKLAVVLDVFSRMPLAAKIYLLEPTADAIANLFRTAVDKHGAPRHFVSDQGSQLTAESFRETLKQHGTKQRFGAIGKTGSIAIIERFWKTLKYELSLRSRKPLFLWDLERRLIVGLVYYAYLRPHQALDGAVPAEAYFRIKPANDDAAHPPRGRPGEWKGDAPFDIAYLDKERRLPFLVPKAA